MIRVIIGEETDIEFSKAEWKVIQYAIMQALEVDKEMIDYFKSINDMDALKELDESLLDETKQKILDNLTFWERLKKLKI